jgi:hypothetical protein
MIVEERMYTLYVGKVPEFMEVYEREGLPILKKHLGHQVGFYINEVGPQNLIVHLWAFRKLRGSRKSPRRLRRRSGLASLARSRRRGVPHYGSTLASDGLIDTH